MKKVMLTALFAFGVGTVQCESFYSIRSLEDLRRWRDEDFNVIKETSEYKKALEVKKGYFIARNLFEDTNARCESFKKNGARLFSGVSETDCKLVQRFEKLMLEIKEASRDADSELEALITKNHPQLKELCLNILTRQDSTIELLEKSANVFPSSIPVKIDINGNIII
jgi:hypothetical protein